MPTAEASLSSSDTWSANSSRNNRRNGFADREYRAKSAPLTTSGKFVSANTGSSRLVKYGVRRRRSSDVNDSAGEGPSGTPYNSRAVRGFVNLTPRGGS